MCGALRIRRARPKACRRRNKSLFRSNPLHPECLGKRLPGSAHSAGSDPERVTLKDWKMVLKKVASNGSGMTSGRTPGEYSGDFGAQTPPKWEPFGRLFRTLGKNARSVILEYPPSKINDFTCRTGPNGTLFAHLFPNPSPEPSFFRLGCNPSWHLCNIWYHRAQIWEVPFLPWTPFWDLFCKVCFADLSGAPWAPNGAKRDQK